MAILAQFEDVGVIEARTPGYLFRQNLFRQTVYATMDSNVRCNLHQCAFRLLICDQKTPSIKLFHHAIRGELWAEAVRYAMQAAEEMKESYAYETALSHLAQAYELLDTYVLFSDDQQARLRDEVLASQQVLQTEILSRKQMVPPAENDNELPQTAHTPPTPRKKAETLTILLAKESAPASGRALRNNEKQTVTWTLHCPEDATIQGKRALRQHRLMRLVQEAQDQGAIPTVEQLAAALGVSDKTIQRDLRQLRQQDVYLSTRGSREQ
ncbi:DUF1670 domain-containing protein [Chloroflexi bacterium TSY]|nr:DUF1670 domain-containing protein [Chloroflexi bacterium TSY]